jgi:hypothetical protein
MAKREGNSGSFAPDTEAFVLLILTVGILTTSVEIFLLGFTLGQWGLTHAIYAFRVPLARFCGRWTNYFSQYFPEKLAGTIALCIYGSATYFLGALIAGVIFAGVDFKQIFSGLATQILSNLAFGWWWSILLNWRRRIHYLKLLRSQA